MEILISDEMKKRASKYIVLTGDEDVDKASIVSLELLRQNAVKHKGNDTIKYSLPESYKVDLIWTINARSLRNFFKLRTSKKALPEMRWLCMEIWGVLPEKVKFLFDDVYDTTVKVGE